MDEYSFIAPYYEKLLGKSLYPIRNNIRTFIHGKGHRKILDMCSGTGRQLEMLQGAGMNLIGIDISQSMIGQAEKVDGTMRFIHTNATDIELPFESYDAVILTFSLHEKDTPERLILLEKSWNLVRMGGNLLVGDYCRVPPTSRGFIWGKILIPIVERAAGRIHSRNYISWMREGALEHHLEGIIAPHELISKHFGETVALYSLEKCWSTS